MLPYFGKCSFLKIKDLENKNDNKKKLYYIYPAYSRHVPENPNSSTLHQLSSLTFDSDNER